MHLMDDGPVYHTASVRLPRAKLTTCFGYQYAMANFCCCPNLEKISQGCTLIFGDTQISFYSAEQEKGSSCAKNQLDSFSRFDRTPTSDRQTDTGPF